MKATTFINGAMSKRYGFEAINAFDFCYGMRGTYEFPLNIQLATDIKMYSRRGYNEPSMNTNDLVWDASVAHTFLKGRMTAKRVGFDILGQLSNKRYNVNAQGVTETWNSSICRYAMLSLSYKINVMPKKK